jgi:hypothetical protein
VNVLIISNALDTNGQNTRYATASGKWGTAPEVLKVLAIGHYDPAGVVARYQLAADKFEFLKIRSVHRAEHIYQQMPADVLWRHNNERQIQAMALEADIIHLNNSTVAARRLRLKRTKPYILHHHGSLFRNNPRYGLQEAKNWRALQLVSTVDLMRPAPDYLHWAPTAYDVDWLQEFGKANRREPDGKVRIVQAPTDGKDGPYKSTAALEAAVATARRLGADVELVIIRDRPWAECMAIKATADIYFDQVKLGYGCNAVEAWGMGIPVIAGADAWTLAKMREVYGTKDLPFYEATEDTILDAVLDLVSSKVTRSKYAKRGLAHVRKFHDELPALTRLAELYTKAINEPADYIEDIKVPPAIFRSEVPQVRVAGRYMTFTDGLLETDNPHIANALRALALRHPRYGIEEVVSDAA